MLADSERVSFAAWRHALSLHGHEMTVQEFEGSIGTTDRDVAELWAPVLGTDPDTLESEARSAFLDRLDQVEVFADAVDLRDRFDGPVAVGTNSARWRLEAILSGAGLSDRFPITVTASDVDRPKPAPDIYAAAFAAMEVAPAQGLVIEDSPSGIASARAAGARVVAVDRGHLPVSALDGADVVVTSLT